MCLPTFTHYFLVESLPPTDFPLSHTLSTSLHSGSLFGILKRTLGVTVLEVSIPLFFFFFLKWRLLFFDFLVAWVFEVVENSGSRKEKEEYERRFLVEMLQRTPVFSPSPICFLHGSWIKRKTSEKCRQERVRKMFLHATIIKRTWRLPWGKRYSHSSV